VTPPYVRTSAGVRAMHLLCHSLNRRGQTAYILLYPAMPWRGDEVAPDLMTPILTPHVVRSHFERGLTPIMVYPETVTGNPFGGPCVVRYVLNFPGLLGGDKVYAPEELCFGYSKILAKETRWPDNILFLPPADTCIFDPTPEGQKRQGTCFYADKYKIVHHGVLSDITKHSVEITRNPYLTEIIALKELGAEGYARSADPAEVARAKATVAQGAKNYEACYARYWQDLDRFIALTREHAQTKAYKAPINLPSFPDTVRLIVQERGLRGFAKAAARKLYKLAVRRA
jgi:hypothetical protein